MPHGNIPSLQAMPFDTTPWLAVQVPAFNAAMEVNRAWVRRSNEVMSHWMSFLLTRYREELRLQQGLMACRSPMEAQQVWAEFLQQATEQYREEFEKIGEMTGKVAGEIGSALRIDGSKPKE
jgi:hypothetical protein